VQGGVGHGVPTWQRRTARRCTESKGGRITVSPGATPSRQGFKCGAQDALQEEEDVDGGNQAEDVVVDAHGRLASCGLLKQCQALRTGQRRVGDLAGIDLSLDRQPLCSDGIGSDDMLCQLAGLFVLAVLRRLGVRVDDLLGFVLRCAAASGSIRPGLAPDDLRMINRMLVAATTGPGIDRESTLDKALDIIMTGLKAQ